MKGKAAVAAAGRPGALEGLNPADPGVRLLIEQLRDVPSGAVLLVCTGDLPGLEPGAPRLILDAREQVGSQGKPIALRLHDVANLDPAEAAGLAFAAVWPRAHLGKDFSQQCLARAGLLLPAGAKVLCSVRKQKGAQTLTDFMGALFGNVAVLGKDKGYRLMCSTRVDAFDAAAATELVQRRYVIEDEILGGISLESAPGVFSRRELDAGTRSLLQYAAELTDAPRFMVDLGCGVGPLCIATLRRFEHARALAVDTNVLAVQLCRNNAAKNGVADRLEVLWRDGLPPWTDDRARAELALVNPPTHADMQALQDLLGPLREWMQPGGRVLLVVSRPKTVADVMKELGAQVVVTPRDRHHIIDATLPSA